MSSGDAKLKVGFVLDDSLDSTDGVQQYVLSLGTFLQSQGHAVHYLVGESKRTDLPNLHSLSRNLKVSFNGNRLSVPLPANKKDIRHLLQTEAFDVLHVQMPYSPFLAGRIISNAPKHTKIFGTFHILPHSSFVSWCNRGLGIIERRTLRRFAQVFAVSPAASIFARQSYGITCTVLPNVIDVARFATAQPFAELTQQDSLTLLFFGRLVPRKGCQTLLEAVVALRKKGLQNFKLIICGTGPLRAELTDYVAKNDLSASVSFTGFVNEPEKPRYYKTADIAIFPSTGGESFGIVLAEAMAAGAVTVAAANPGYASVLDNQPEVLFEPGNSAQLAEKLEQFLKDPAVRTKAKAWQQARVAGFDTAVVGNQLLEAYYKVIAAGEPDVHNTN